MSIGGYSPTLLFSCVGKIPSDDRISLAESVYLTITRQLLEVVYIYRGLGSTSRCVNRNAPSHLEQPQGAAESSAPALLLADPLLRLTGKGCWELLFTSPAFHPHFSSLSRFLFTVYLEDRLPFPPIPTPWLNC